MNSNGINNEKKRCPHAGLNYGPPVYKTGALPLSYRGSEKTKIDPENRFFFFFHYLSDLFFAYFLFSYLYILSYFSSIINLSILPTPYIHKQINHDDAIKFYHLSILSCCSSNDYTYNYSKYTATNINNRRNLAVI